MKILYISHQSTNIAAGPNWSVPASVDAQSLIDEVLWINMTNMVMPHWKKIRVFHNIEEFGGTLNSLNVLPSPFNRPDVVVLESFYHMNDVRIAKKLRKEKIPYIIIPRGALTQQALHNHARFKKWIAHKLFFDGYVRYAAAIQYLTKQEAKDSVVRFSTPYFVIPNGVKLPQKVKNSFSPDRIIASFIGRLDMYHKGIDLLLDAMELIHKELVKSRFCLTIYGPRRYDYEKIKSEIASRNMGDVAKVYDEVSGDEKENVLLNSDLFIMTSRFEGHPMGLLEALSYGIPCMVTPGTNMAEEVGMFNAGWVTEGNAEKIAETIKQIIMEKSCFSEKGYNGRELSKDYDWNKLALKFHEELETILQNR